jgi:hypothetical protein
MGNVVLLLGFTTLGCGCVIGRYRDLATRRELEYVEEKGGACQSHSHRRNHILPADRPHRARTEALALVDNSQAAGGRR